MDTKQEMRFLGFFGILEETFKLIFIHKKLFTQITLALIVPLNVVFQANIITSHLITSKIFEEEVEDSLQFKDFSIYRDSNPNFSNLKPLKWEAYRVLLQLAYDILFLVPSLLCTSTVAYSIFCKYNVKDVVTFKKAKAIVPKIWKQVLYTYLVSFGIVLLYDNVLGAILVLNLRFLFKEFTSIFLIVIVMIFFFAGSTYISIISHLGIVVSVLEENVYGVQALRKSMKLIRGKFGVAATMLIFFSVFSGSIDGIFESYVVHDALSLNWGIRIGIGSLCFILQLMAILFGLVVQTVIYFVCNAHLNSNEDFEVKIAYFVCKSNLNDEDFEVNIVVNAP